MNLNSPPLPFPAQKFMDDYRLPYPIECYHSSSMATCHNFFKSCQDRTEDYEFEHLKAQPDGNYAGGSSSHMIKDTDESDLELSLWKKGDQGHGDHTNNRWMSSKRRLMEKNKNPPDRVTLKLTTALTTKVKDQKSHLTTHLETDRLSCNNSSIRVCSDCNTTKTPLWRSGPKGPKSLCNACGIRQRKARRAMASAAAAADGCTANKPLIKVHREKTERYLGRQSHASQTKKRCKAAAAAHVAGPGRLPPNNGPPKRRFEDLIINLSKKLAIHRVFPQDEKDAAILLMALSYGLVHG